MSLAITQFLKKKSKKRQIREPLPEPPFRLLMIAPSGGGKTNVIANLLTNKNFQYRKYFNKIYIFSRSAELDDTFEYMAEKNGRIKLYNDFDEEKIESILGKQSEDKSKKVLIVFDDLGDAKVMSNNKKDSIYSVLYNRGRHYNISVITSNQYLHTIPKNVRNSCSQVILFGGLDEELPSLSKTYSIGMSSTTFQKLYKKIIKKKYSFLYIDLSSNKIYEGFENEIKFRT